MWFITEPQNGPEGTLEIIQEGALETPLPWAGTQGTFADPGGWEEGMEQAEGKKET